MFFIKKRLSIFIVCSIILANSVLFSCSSGNNDKTNTTTQSQDSISNSDGNNSQVETTTSRVKPNIPENTDLSDHVFTVLSHQENSSDWKSPDPREIVYNEEVASGDTINDAVYKRNQDLKDLYGIEMNLITNTAENTVLQKSVKSGDDLYDMVMIFGYNVSSVIQNDLLVEVGQLPYVDLSQPYWDAAALSTTVMGKNFLLTGDATILDNDATNCLIFNKDLFNDYGMDLPYQMVLDGKWTFDKMNEYIKNSSRDLNGDGQMDELNDRWGMFAFKDTLHALLVSGGGRLAEKDSNDVPYYDYTNDKNSAIIEAAMDIMYNDKDVLNIQNIDGGGDGNPNQFAVYYDGFADDRALLSWVRIAVIEHLRGMESNFGIVPLPKFTESQESYYSVVNSYTNVMLGVPKSVQNLERVSIFLEALAAEGRNTLQPAYYNVALTGKYTRDDESEQMLDIIFNNRVYDIGAVYNFGNTWLDFIGLYSTLNRNYVSFYEKRASSVQKAVDKLI